MKLGRNLLIINHCGAPKVREVPRQEENRKNDRKIKKKKKKNFEALVKTATGERKASETSQTQNGPYRYMRLGGSKEKGSKEMTCWKESNLRQVAQGLLSEVERLAKDKFYFQRKMKRSAKSGDRALKTGWK